MNFERCGWMSADTYSQCILAVGHTSLHIWEEDAPEEPKQLTLEEVYGTVEIK